MTQRDLEYSVDVWSGLSLEYWVIQLVIWVLEWVSTSGPG